MYSNVTLAQGEMNTILIFLFFFSECYKVVIKCFSKMDVFCHSGSAVLVSYKTCLLVVSYTNTVWSFFTNFTPVCFALTCICLCWGQLPRVSSFSGMYKAILFVGVLIILKLLILFKMPICIISLLPKEVFRRHLLLSFWADSEVK